MRFLIGCCQFYASLFAAYVDRDDTPVLPEPDWTDGNP